MEPYMESNKLSGFIRQKHLLPLLGFSAPTLWRKVKNGTFPKPIKLGENITAWLLDDVSEWIEVKKNG
jgi:predicted DNA-binding transcriptional regulator AlpA